MPMGSGMPPASVEEGTLSRFACVLLLFTALLTSRPAAAARTITQEGALATHYWQGFFQYTQWENDGTYQVESGDTVVHLYLTLDGIQKTENGTLGSSTWTRFYISLHNGSQFDLGARMKVRDSSGMLHTIDSNTDRVSCEP